MPFESRRERRDVTDATTLRAMAHPLRLRLMELLYAEGPLTATQASERVGESPANCSFHLRTLAKYGFVEEADGGSGRSRPWRVVPGGTRIQEENLAPEAVHASRALTRTLRGMVTDELDRWYAAKARYPGPWRRAAFENQSILHLTAEELQGIENAIDELLAQFETRTARQRPDGALPVLITAAGVPTAAPPEDAQ
jgi:DNA-binding transcriptional ArsR family regulator